MGRHQTNVSGWAGGPGDGEGWAKGYKVEWGEVVGHRIRRLRQARGWTLAELQRRVQKPGGESYSTGYFSRLERGWTSPPLYVYVEIARVFEVAPGDLLGTEDFDRELSSGQRLLVGLVERLGLTTEDAIVRLTTVPAAER
jgi:transcriptional regulator with XRE-family HTH domain